MNWELESVWTKLANDKHYYWILDVDDPNKKLITLELKSSIDELDDNELFARFQHSSDKPVGSSEDTTTLLLEAKGNFYIGILFLIIINHMSFMNVLIMYMKMSLIMSYYLIGIHERKLWLQKLNSAITESKQHEETIKSSRREGNFWFVHQKHRIIIIIIIKYVLIFLKICWMSCNSWSAGR